MAKSKKTKSDKSSVDAVADKTAELILTQDDIVVEDSAAPVDMPDDEYLEDLEAPEPDIDFEIEADPETEMEIVDGIADDAVEAGEELPEVETPTAQVEPQPVQNTSSSFLALLLGGVAAGAIGYGVATYYLMNGGSGDFADQINAQSEQIAAIEAQLAEVNLSGVESQITALDQQTTVQVAEISDLVSSGMAQLDARLVEVERLPNADGTLSDTALAAYRRELEELRTDIDAQQQNVMSAAAQAEADLAAARAEAERLEQDALAAAQAAASRAALNRVATAVETGAPFADAIGDLGGDLPAALTTAAETGVATNAALTSDFPAAARAALATARSEGVSGESGGVGAFFRNQFDVRSTAPQTGDTPDAILSRAEAAVKEGRVADALAEIEALPEVVRAELTDWTAQATQRADVLSAIATLSETYN